MATKTKPWPHTAEWTRMDCIAIAHQGRKDLLAVLDDVDHPRVLRFMTKAIEAFREIESKLREVRNENSAGGETPAEQTKGTK